MPCRATQDEWVIVKSSDKMLSTGMQAIPVLLLENTMTLKDDPSRSEGIQYATGEEQTAITNTSRKNEAAGPKQK